ncbi:hypothetical protein BDV59DRAFT_199325 [Aspergillus ambiguus]|uniref:uncharacterized protein n=1 Tax=Aspergillus ambiguus TaxID=176160 RepID=UPI003CCD55BB
MPLKMEKFHMLDPEGDLLVVAKKSTNAPFERDHLVLDLVKIEKQSPGCLMYESSSSDKDSAATDEYQDQSRYFEHGRILVSSKRLCLASPYLAMKLRFDADVPLKNVVIPDPVHDIQALLIVFDILHSTTNMVPLVINFPMLLSIAALVQHFDCADAVQAFAHIWIENLRPAISLFTAGTCPGGFGQQPLGFEQLPLLPDSIETIRQESIGSILIRLYDRIEAATQGKCDALILDKVIQLLEDHGLYPRPEYPFRGISVNMLLEALGCLGEPEYRSFMTITHEINDSSLPGGMVGADIQELEQLCEEVQGLDIAGLAYGGKTDLA